MRKGLEDWYFIVPGTDDTFSCMEGIYTHRLTSDYSIEMGKRSTKPGLCGAQSAGNLFPYLSSDGSALSAGFGGESVYGTFKRSMGHSYERCAFKCISVELAEFIKRSAKQVRLRYVPEYDALSIESEVELLLVSLSVDIKDWLRKKGEQIELHTLNCLSCNFLFYIIYENEQKICIIIETESFLDSRFF
ncbi:hypothetical protein ACFWDG_17640 [Peribacillus sp. NPDC060186]